jgi:Fe2+ or Zn2+ uptake regulation protein
MSIEKEAEVYKLYCDVCGENEEFPTFTDAVKYKKPNGWESKHQNDEWFDICEECLNG